MESGMHLIYVFLHIHNHVSILISIHYIFLHTQTSHNLGVEGVVAGAPNSRVAHRLERQQTRMCRAASGK